IWAKVRVEGPSSIAMKWQPMPALAKLPSGNLVDVACGQPAQNAGARRSKPSGRSAGHRNVVTLLATLSGDNSISGDSSAEPFGAVLPLISGRSSAGRWYSA